MAAESTRLHARWVFSVDDDPIQDGTVEIDGGRIAGVHGTFTSNAHDLGNVALIPGLVNAHSHLEFSDITQPLEPSELFADWLRALVRHRRNRSESVVNTINHGFRESARSGTTLIGEIATDGWSPDAFADLGPRMVVFRELIGLPKEQLTEQLMLARKHLEQVEQDKRSNLVRGLSPHAAYSVHPELFDWLVDLAFQSNVPVAVHLAETTAELQLLKNGTGPLVELMRDYNVWSDSAIPRFAKPLNYIKPLAKLRCALVIHGNYLDAEEIEFLAQHPWLSVIYCPRTHAYFGNSTHPWRTMLQRGVSLAIGTDSRASNPDLSIWRELLFLRERFPDVDPRILLQLGTIRGARALGLEIETGSLSAGKSADLAVVELGKSASTDPYSLLFDRSSRIVATMRAGHWFDH